MTSFSSDNAPSAHQELIKVESDVGRERQEFSAILPLVVHKMEEVATNRTLLYPSACFWANPARRGPADRQRYEAAGWRYEEYTMDTHSFLAANKGRMSLRGIPIIPTQDQWETSSSVRSQVQYWFDTGAPQNPTNNDDFLVRTWNGTHSTLEKGANLVSPIANDTSHWDFEVLQAPKGTVTIAIWRPLRRGFLPPWFRRGNEWIPTNKDFPWEFSHRPNARATWLPDDVDLDEHPPVVKPIHDDL